MSCMNHDPNHQSAMHSTMAEKYGSPHALQIKEFNDKFKRTIGNKETDPERWKLHSERIAETCLKKYGVDNVFKSEQIKDSIRRTNLERYGVEHVSQSEVIKERQKQTVNERVKEDPDFWRKRQAKTEKTYLEKYGTEHPQRDIGLGIEQRKDTCLKKYGKKWYTQTHECHVSRRKRIEADGLQFDSLWEKMVYQHCVSNGIPCEYHPMSDFCYEFNGKVCCYQPDFLIGGKYYEVKGNHFFRTNEQTGEEEMFLPFRGRNVSDNDYDMACKQYNAKFKFMKDNGIIILREWEIRNLDKVLCDGSRK